MGKNFPRAPAGDGAEKLRSRGSSALKPPPDSGPSLGAALAGRRPDPLPGSDSREGPRGSAQVAHGAQPFGDAGIDPDAFVLHVLHRRLRQVAVELRPHLRTAALLEIEQVHPLARVDAAVEEELRARGDGARRVGLGLFLDRGTRAAFTMTTSQTFVEALPLSSAAATVPWWVRSA